jgi:uncharacterized protein
VKRAKLIRVWCCAAALFAGGMLLTACGAEKAAASAEIKSASTYFPIKIGDRVAQLQIAALPNELQLGLMNRRDLKPDEGMIFIFARPQRMGFYMRNTPTPLTIGYFDSDGVLREKYDMHPFDETTVSSRSDRIQFCVEMHQGWYDRNGIKPGAQLDLKAVMEALKARGFDPIEFGMAKHLKR